MTTAEAITWIEAKDGYHLGVDESSGKPEIVARNAKGKQLKSVPAAVKKTEAYADLDAALAWLESHTRDCAAQVETWLLRSQPVPTQLIAAVWPDPSWQQNLRDLVVAPIGATGADPEVAGFLRAAETAEDSGTGQARVGVVNLDGESVWLDSTEVRLPHPVLLPELADLREFAAELEITQEFNQLQREVHPLPDPLPEASVTELATWAGALFEQRRFLAGRATSAGFAIKGNMVVTRVQEGGQTVEAGLWIDGDHPEEEAALGPLSWTAEDRTLPVREVGPVAYSEGVRMAEYLYAGRKIEDDPEQ